jgi:hypothetical protein
MDGDTARRRHIVSANSAITNAAPAIIIVAWPLTDVTQRLSANPRSPRV